MKRSELFFSFLLVPLDFIMIILAGLSAYYIRFARFFTEIRPVIFNLTVNDYLKILIPIGLSWLVIFALAGLYRIKSKRRFAREFYRVVLACSTGLMLIVVLIFVRRELFDSRFIVLAGWIFAVVYITLARGFIRGVQNYLHNFGIGVHKLAIVGNSKTTEILVHDFCSNKKLGYGVAKRLRGFSIAEAQELEEFLKTGEVDEILQSDPNLSKAEIIRLYDFASEHHLTFKYAADLLGAKVLKTEVTDISGVPIVEVIKTPLEGWGRIVKRFFDVAVSSILIIILSPILAITAVLIKIDSHGPIFFSRRDDGSRLFRVGQGGRLFKYIKFRSMIPGTDEMRYKELAEKNIRKGEPLVKIKDDPRITRIGKFIRRTSIDELPELFLVLKGDMSLVGPRPHLPEEVAKYELHHKKVLTIKPGISGLAQISGRSDLNFEDEVKLDTYYIENWSLLLDMSILLRTPFAVVRPRKAE
ncbi:MAG: sugar transferase [Patescibacteria group bacterium]|jgi:exopolysaccharide biosynthesis polyprenyl glycosylphosphotransferase